MRLHQDQAAAAIIIALAACTYALTLTFPEVPSSVRQGMGPERFPQLVLFVIVALSLVLMVQSRGTPEIPLEPIDSAVLPAVLGGIVFMGVLWLVGMVVAMGLAIISLGLLWGERRVVPLVLNAILLPAAIWALFVLGLKVPLPGGTVAPLLGLS